MHYACIGLFCKQTKDKLVFDTQIVLGVVNLLLVRINV